MTRSWRACLARRRRRGDAGLGLPELLVSVGLGGVLLLALGSTVVHSLRTSAQATTRVTNSAELRDAMDVVARRLRLAVRPRTGVPAFEVAGPRTVRFYASLLTPGAPDADPPPTLVEYTVEAACLRETRTVPSGTNESTWSWTVGATTTSRCLTRSAVNPAGSALFTYYATTGPATSATPPPETPLGTGGAVTGADLDAVRSVLVNADLKSTADSAVSASRARTRVTLVNLPATP